MHSSNFLNALRAERTSIADKLQELSAQKARLENAKDREKEAAEALRELADAEIAVIRRWASEGSAGDPPQPDMERREQLARDLAAAKAFVTAASGVAADIDAEIQAANDDLRNIQAQIEAEALASLEQAFIDENAEHCRQAEELHRQVAANAAFHRWLTDKGRALNDHAQARSANQGHASNIAAGREFWVLASRLAELPKPLVPEVGEVLKHVSDWGARFEEMTR
jgi:hypothetical protein